MLITTKAIVIHSLRYSEADLIVTCFTESSGIKTYLLRNILKSKKGKLKKAMFQSLTQLEIVANHKNKNTLESIREAKIDIPYKNLHTDIYKSSISMFLAETLKNTIQEEEENIALYRFLSQAFQKLDELEKFANFHLFFLVHLTHYLGFSPNLSSTKHPYFNLLDGDFQIAETNKYCISNQNSELLKQFLKSDYDNFASIKLNKIRRQSFLEMLLLYFQLHLQGFRKPKSLEILNQLFS
ncbi:DNA repair protein RecO [Mesonia aquimarina]|uniref:DNA repair protein RecO n=1 Tax=Mesonia aquimarina TaxID=1504967 RepID=UPI000EF5B4D0|nr:DNA repair protein RecO [Mesonia aquimarina]